MKTRLVLTLLLLPLAGLLAKEPALPQAKAETLIKGTTDWQGQTLPAYGTGQPEVTLLKITIPPGVTLPIHEHPVINAAIVTKGVLTVVATESGKTLTAKAGDAFIEMVNEPHYGRNEGTEPVELYVFYAGTKGTPITVLKQEVTNETGHP